MTRKVCKIEDCNEPIPPRSWSYCIGHRIRKSRKIIKTCTGPDCSAVLTHASGVVCRDHVKWYHQNYRRKNRNRQRINSSRSRAKKRGLEFELTVDCMEWPSHCPILGIELDYNTSGKLQDNSPSIDRIDNARGYLQDNVAVISTRANTLKNSATLEEVERIYTWLKRKHQTYSE